jgi:hypothetical protein
MAWRRGLTLMLWFAGSSSGAAQQLEEPFTPSARWSLYVQRTYSPSRMAFLAVDAAVDHALRQPVCWDFSADSYERRFARALQSRIVKNSAELVGGLLTGEDLRYRRSRSLKFRGRLWNAMRSSVTAQMPDGSSRPAYTRFFASELASVSVARWTRRPVQPRQLVETLWSSTLDQAQTNVLDEFGPDLRRIGMRIWKGVRYRRQPTVRP